MRQVHKWTEEEINYLKSISDGRNRKEIINLMKEKFSYNYTDQQVIAMMKRKGIKSNIDTKFKNGHKCINNFKTGYYPKGAEKGWFKKGEAKNCREIGDERIIDGYIEIKIAEPNVWERKHRYIYMQYYGEIPVDSVVIFLDKNKMNFDINNLALITKSQLAILNKNNLIKDDSEITKTSILLSALILKCSEVLKDS